MTDFPEITIEQFAALPHGSIVHDQTGSQWGVRWLILQEPDGTIIGAPKPVPRGWFGNRTTLVSPERLFEFAPIHLIVDTGTHPVLSVPVQKFPYNFGNPWPGDLINYFGVDEPKIIREVPDAVTPEHMGIYQFEDLGYGVYPTKATRCTCGGEWKQFGAYCATAAGAKP